MYTRHTCKTTINKNLEQAELTCTCGKHCVHTSTVCNERSFIFRPRIQRAFFSTVILSMNICQKTFHKHLGDTVIQLFSPCLNFFHLHFHKFCLVLNSIKYKIYIVIFHFEILPKIDYDET